MTKNLIPLSELPSASEYDPYQSDSPSVTWDVELPPHVDTERLLFNMSHMHRLQKLGYFSVNHFASYHGDSTQYEPTIVGMNPDGTAIAGRKASAIKKAELSKDTAESPAEGRLAANYFKAEGQHDLNRSELSRLVTERLQRSPSDRSSDKDTKAWAKTLDTATQDSVVTAARHHLIDRTLLPIRLLDIGLYSGSIVENVLNSHSPDSLLLGISELVVMRMGVFAGFDSFVNKAEYGSTYIKERRWSSFAAMQPEAYVALHGLASINSLIRYRK